MSKFSDLLSELVNPGELQTSQPPPQQVDRGYLSPEVPARTEITPPFESKYMEDAFQSWYRKNYPNLNPNPDDPSQFYDYRAAFEAGDASDDLGHGSSQFKLEGHPNRYVRDQGQIIDSITGIPVTDFQNIPEYQLTNLRESGELSGLPLVQEGEAPASRFSQILSEGMQMQQPLAPVQEPVQDLDPSFMSEYGKAAKESFLGGWEIAKSPFMSKEKRDKMNLPFILEDSPTASVVLGGLGMAFSWLTPAVQLQANSFKTAAVLLSEAGKMDISFQGTPPSEMFPELDEPDRVEPSEYAFAGRRYHAGGEEQESVFDKWSMPSYASLVSSWDSPRFQRELKKIGRFAPGEGPTTGSGLTDTILEFIPGPADILGGYVLKAAKMSKLARKKYLKSKMGDDGDLIAGAPEGLWEKEAILSTKFGEELRRNLPTSKINLGPTQDQGLYETLSVQQKSGARIDSVKGMPTTPEEQIFTGVRTVGIEGSITRSILSTNFGNDKYQIPRSYEADYGRKLSVVSQQNQKSGSPFPNLLNKGSADEKDWSTTPDDLERVMYDRGHRAKAKETNRLRKEQMDLFEGGYQEHQSLRNNPEAMGHVWKERARQLNPKDTVQDKNAAINQTIPREISPEDMQKLYEKADETFGGRNLFFGNRQGQALKPDGSPMISETTGIDPQKVEVQPGVWEMRAQNVTVDSHPSVVQSMGMGPDGPYTYEQYRALNVAMDNLRELEKGPDDWVKRSVEKTATGEARGFQKDISDPEMGWVKRFGVQTWRVIDRNIISSGLMRMSTISPDAKDLTIDLMMLRKRQRQRIGAVQYDMKQLFKGMSEGDRIKVGEVMEGLATSDSKRINHAATEMRHIYDTLAIESSYANVHVLDMVVGHRPFIKKKDYVPTMVKPDYLKNKKKIKQLKEYQNRELKRKYPEMTAEERAINIGEHFHNTEKLGYRVSHLNFSNRGAIPDWAKVKDPWIIGKEYTDQVIPKLEAAHTFGLHKDGSHPKLENFFARIQRDSPDDFKYVRDMTLAELGLDMRRPFLYTWGNLMKGVASFRFLTIHSGILNTTQTMAGVPLSGSWKAYQKAVTKVFEDLEGSADIAMRAGAVTDRAVKDVMSQMIGTSKAADWWAHNVTKIPQSEYWNRVIAYHSGREYLEELAVELIKLNSKMKTGGRMAKKKAGDEIEVVRRTIEELTINPDDIIKNNGLLTERQLMDAGYEFNIQVNFSADPMRNPLVAAHPFFGIFYQFRNFPVHRARQLNREVGDYIRRAISAKAANPAEYRKMRTQFAAFASSSALAGTVIFADDYLIEMASYLQNGVIEGRWNWTKDQTSVAQEFVEMSMASSMGMYYSIIAAQRYGNLEMLGGTPYSLYKEGKDLVTELSTGEFDEAMRAVRANIPGYQRYVDPVEWPEQPVPTRRPTGFERKGIAKREF